MLRRLSLLALLLPACADDGGSGDDAAATTTTSPPPTTAPPDTGTLPTSSTTTAADDTGSGTTTTADDPLTVSFLLPLDGGIVAGVTAIDLAVTGPATNVELWVDGALLASTDLPPYSFAWDTALAHGNDTPAPTHPLDLGYYFPDGRYGDFRADFADYTNLYYACPCNYPTDQPWGDAFSQAMADAVAAGRQIHINMAGPESYDEVLDRAAPHWAAVRRLEAADEPGWTLPETEAILADIRAKLDARGLPHLPIGAVYTGYQVLNEDAIFAAGLDWVGLEAYVDPPGSPDPAVNAAVLADFMTAAKARVPAEKNLVIVMQAYDRNGQWPDIPALTALQDAVYLHAVDDPRVLALTMFSYGRPGGTADHPEIAAPHKRMGERILGVTVPSLSDGPHTLVARAYAGGDTVEATRAVTVDNP